MTVASYSIPATSTPATGADNVHLHLIEPSSDDHDEADREWQESLHQLQHIFSLILVPYVGKYFGRKCAYWGWARVMEWKFPVDVVMSSRSTFESANVAEAVYPL